jgi:hypothetical protein
MIQSRSEVKDMSKQKTEKKAAISQGEAISLRELIEQQHISPVNNLDEISDLWPADDDPDLLLEHILNDRVERRRLKTERETN